LLDGKVYKPIWDYGTLVVWSVIVIQRDNLLLCLRNKATLGITGLPRVGVQILLVNWHLDVDSSYPPGARAGKGAAVLRIKRNVNWVKYVVRQYGPYLLREK